MVVATTLALLSVLGIAPLDLGGADGSGRWILAVAPVVLGASVVTIVKGKPRVGMIGIFVPAVAIAGAVRLARPTSGWARRRYAPQSTKARRAADRDARWSAWRDTWMNRLGGAPSS